MLKLRCHTSFTDYVLLVCVLDITKITALTINLPIQPFSDYEFTIKSLNRDEAGSVSHTFDDANSSNDDDHPVLLHFKAKEPLMTRTSIEFCTWDLITNSKLSAYLL